VIPSAIPVGADESVVSLAVGRPPSQRNQGTSPSAKPSAPRRSKHQRRQRTLAIIAGVTLLAVLLGTVAAGFAGRSDDTSSSTSSTSTTPSTTSAAPPVPIALPAPGESITGETPCPAADGSSPRTTSFESAPPTCIDPSRRYTARIETSAGPISLLLNTDVAPGIVNNFVVLSRYHFYDDVPFFSIVPQKYLATGDAVGDPNGTGDPGYTVPDEIPEAGAIYPWGTVAMAGRDGEPDTNGSIFIIASGDDAADLPPVFTVFGQVLDGSEAMKAINEAGNASTGQPSKDIRIESITIVEE
jgi:cyclophilin family peptidyl-prolyl cis-trans isomerase